MRVKPMLLIKLAILILLNLCLILFASIATDTPIQVLSREGSRGEQVRQIQVKLKSLGYLIGSADGVYGNSTADAVRRWQRDNGLTPDGVAGVQTLAGLGFTFRQGDRGEDVSSIQSRLKSLGYLSGGADGVFGSSTASAVKAFQKQNGLTQDGVVGLSTAKKLYSPSAARKPASGGAHSDSDYYLLARMISAEARGEDFTGQVAVGAVILNRVNHPSFPDTVAGVIYQPGAFSAIDDGQFNEPIAESSYRAAKEALNGSDPSGGAIYYYNPAKTSNAWIRTRPVIKRIGEHLFCS